MCGLLRCDLQITASVLELGEVIRSTGEGPALHDFAYGHFNSHVIFLLEVRRKPGQTRTFVAVNFSICRHPRTRLPINTARESILCTIKAIVFDNNQHSLSDCTGNV